MATTQTSYGVRSLRRKPAKPRTTRPTSASAATLDVGAFGVSAAFQRKAGETLIREHDEAGPGADRHEELYVVVQGGATFTVDGEEVDAPQGTAIFVRDPDAKRGAVATADDTHRPRGRRPPGRGVPRHAGVAATRASSTRTARRTTPARSRRRSAASRRIPATRNLLYNVACMEALLGNRRDGPHGARRVGRQVGAVQGAGARRTTTSSSLREDPRFLELVA